MSSVERVDDDAETVANPADSTTAMDLITATTATSPDTATDRGASTTATGDANVATSHEVGLPPFVPGPPAQAYLDEVGERALHIAGVRNARDIGGLSGALGTVRRGRVLRSAALDHLTPEGARTLADLGLRTIFDLRTGAERGLAPSRPAEAPELAHVATVVLDYLGTLDDLPAGQFAMYRHIADRSGTGIVEFFERLGRSGTAPVLVHCTAGKDRTGLTIALLLELLGVSRTAIAADYVASNNGLLGRALPSNLTAEILEQTFAMMDQRHGSPLGYLRAHGLTDSTVDALRTALLS